MFSCFLKRSKKLSSTNFYEIITMFKTPRKCRMINVNPGYVETRMTENVTTNKLTAEECAEQIVHSINLPQHIEIGELSLWRPY